MGVSRAQAAGERAASFSAEVRPWSAMEKRSVLWWDSRALSAVAPLDLPILLRAPRPDVAVPDPGLLDREHEVEGEVLPAVGLDFPDGKRQDPAELGEEVDAGAGVEPRGEAQDAVSRAIVARGVLIRSPAAPGTAATAFAISGVLPRTPMNQAGRIYLLIARRF